MFATLMLLLSVAVITADGLNLCEETHNCDCHQNQTSFHLYCPKLDRKVRISIPKDAELSSTVTCDISTDFPILPQLYLGKIYGIEFINCSIPANDSFGSMIQQFGIQPHSLVIDNMGHSLLHHQLFRGCKYLTVLIIRNNRKGKTELDENIFQGLPDLLELNLSDNKITDLDKVDVFKSLDKLHTLKLSNNKLEWLTTGIFTHQNNLLSLHLDNNRLISLTRETFTGLSSLKNLDLKRNNFKRLSRSVFHNIPNLRFIALGNINARYKIPDDVFAANDLLDMVFLERLTISKGLHLGSITALSIEDCEFENFSNNSLTNIIPLSVSGSRDVTHLSLSRNQLTDLPDGLFDGFKKLYSLQLSNNNLTTISGLIFQDLHNLQELNLAHNHLSAIQHSAFTNTTHLKLVDLSNNQLSFKDRRSPFMHLVQLVTLDLSNNNLSAVPTDLKYMKALSRLNLAFNNISSYKYMDFSCKLPDLEIHYEPEVKTSMTDSVSASTLLLVFLNNNPLECDCSLFEFLQSKGALRYQLLSAISNICDEHITSQELQHIRCYNNNLGRLPFKCPDKCECLINVRNKSKARISVHCANRGLMTLPEIPSIANETYTLELYVYNNSLKELPNLQNNLHVIVIQASKNSIDEIKAENLPPNLRALDVSHNNIKTISHNVYEVLRNHKKLEVVILADNPWLCDCTEVSRALIKFVEKNMSLTDLQEATCRGSTGNYTLSSGNVVGHLDELCSHPAISLASIVLTVLAFLIGISGILFYKYQRILKVWLYAHHACSWFIDEEELDKDKKYDAFISYSHHDNDFAHRVVNELEQNSPFFKLCVHERDFLVGKLIAESIVESMNNSRRTIVILSKHFLESVWGLHEFHCAYVKGLSEKRIRIIIIIYGDIGEMDKLDPAIKSYLTTRTYIKWGDPWFWEKLRYALPHRN